MDMRRKFAAAIEATQDPLAPIVLNQLYSSTERVGRMFASNDGVNKEEVLQYTARLLKNFPDRKIDKISATPEFIIALCGMLSSALIGYGNKL